LCFLAPLRFDALAFLLSAAVVARMAPLDAPRPDPGGRTRLSARIGRGLAFVWTDGATAAAVMAAFGVHAVVWGTAATTLRQRITPDRLLGRVGSVHRLADLGTAALGAVLGGLLAEHAGLLAPFWVAAAAVGLLAVLAWRPLGAVENTQFLP
jgi:predicted MFS family arabinose efflux permease